MALVFVRVSADRGYTATEPMSLSILDEVCLDTGMNGDLSRSGELLWMKQCVLLDWVQCLRLPFISVIDWGQTLHRVRVVIQSVLYFCNRQGCIVCLEETSLYCTIPMLVISRVLIASQLTIQRCWWGLIWLWSSFDNTENIKHETHCIMEAQLHILMTLPPTLF